MLVEISGEENSQRAVTTIMRNLQRNILCFEGLHFCVSVSLRIRFLLEKGRYRRLPVLKTPFKLEDHAVLLIIKKELKEIWIC